MPDELFKIEGALLSTLQTAIEIQLVTAPAMGDTGYTLVSVRREPVRLIVVVRNSEGAEEEYLVGVSDKKGHDEMTEILSKISLTYPPRPEVQAMMDREANCEHGLPESPRDNDDETTPPEGAE